VLLFRLVTGRDPYHQFSDRDAFIMAQREGLLEPPRLHAWAYSAPDELADLVHDCTQRDGSQRPTMPQILARLDALASSSSIETPAAAPAPEPEQAEQDEHVERVESVGTVGRRTRPLLVVALVLAVAVLLLLAWIVLELRRRTAELERDDRVVLTQLTCNLPDDEQGAQTPEHEGEIGEPSIETDTGSGYESVPQIPTDTPAAEPKPKPKPTPPEPTCEGVESDARAAAQRRKWATVIQLTERKRCWTSSDERTRLRVNALLSSRRNADCVKAGRGSRDPEVLSTVKTCEALVEANPSVP
jgi:HAMP domain-containing protein